MSDYEVAERVRAHAETQRVGLRHWFRRSRKDIVICAMIVLLGLAVRLAYLIFATGKQPLQSDAIQYFQIASNFAQGHGFSDRYPSLWVHETAFRPPIYPMFLGVFFFFFGPSAGLARGLNVVLGLGTITLTFVVLRRYVSLTAATVAAVVVALSPNLIANDTYVLDEPLSLCFIIVLIWALLARRWWLAGVLSGLLVLTRPSAQFFIVIVAVWVIVNVNWRVALRLVLIAGLVVSPWLIRNWVQLGEPVVVTSNGFNWAAVYSPAAQKAGGFIDPTQNPAYDKNRVLQFNELNWNNVLQSQGIHALLEHPRYELHVLRQNLSFLSDLWPSMNDGPNRLDGRDLRIAHDTVWFFYAEVILGSAGLFLARRQSLAQLFFLEGIYFTAASLVFISVPRLRSPLDLALAVGVGFGADWFVQQRAGKNSAEVTKQPESAMMT